MSWTSKRLRWSASVRSKGFLFTLCFISGYLFHYFLPLQKRDSAVISSHSKYIEYIDVDVLLVVLIFSSVKNLSKRDTIRETWLSGFSDNKDVKYYFVLSSKNSNEYEKRSILKEQNIHNDLLIFIDLEDSFYSLTQKLVSSFDWLTNTSVVGGKKKSENKKPFGNFKFLLKCDDDSFVRLEEIIHELETVYDGKKGENLYWGFFDGRARVKKSGKYKEDQWNICDYYIPYALGGGYVIAKSLVEFIARNGDHLKKYNSEDISVGAWLSSYSDLKRVHDPRFDTEYLSRGCHQSYLITHKHSETAIRNFHNNIKLTGNLCQKEYKTRMSYIYNWQVPPSKCCPRIDPNIP